MRRGLRQPWPISTPHSSPSNLRFALSPLRSAPEAAMANILFPNILFAQLFLSFRINTKWNPFSPVPHCEFVQPVPHCDRVYILLAGCSRSQKLLSNLESEVFFLFVLFKLQLWIHQHSRLAYGLRLMCISILKEGRQTTSLRRHCSKEQC